MILYICLIYSPPVRIISLRRFILYIYKESAYIIYQKVTYFPPNVSYEKDLILYTLETVKAQENFMKKLIQIFSVFSSLMDYRL